MDVRSAAPTVHELYERRIAEHGFEPDAAQLAAVEQLDELRGRLLRNGAAIRPQRTRWVPWSRRPRAERGLYLWGEVGRGKTWLMDLFVHSLPEGSVRRRHFHRFMHEAHETLKMLREHPDPLDLAAEQLARDTRVLCFDELAVADIADAMILGGLFKGLLGRGISLVATSNQPPRDLYLGGLKRERFLPTIALIEQHTEVFELAGPTDYRLRRLKSAGLYQPADAPDTPERLRALFDRLGGPGAEGGVIEIADRPIAVVRRSHDAIWFDFPALCATPRSPEDYIEIAREFATVVLENVPVLDALDDAQARRLITLVDELYDRGVNLIVSAAAPPADLYRGERLAAEFRRTSSRLVEMQSEQYLSREHRP